MGLPSHQPSYGIESQSIYTDDIPQWDQSYRLKIVLIYY